jgi:hypothetical protein
MVAPAARGPREELTRSVDVSGLLRSAVVALASAPPGVGVRGRALARLRSAGARALLSTMMARQHLGELLVSLEGKRPGAGGDGERRAVLDAVRRWPTTCLYRALAGYAALRADGTDVRFVIGVRPDRGDLVAHAWLERGGEPVGETADPRERYAVAFVHPAAGGTGQKKDGQEIPMSQPRPSPDVLLTELKDGTGVLLHLKTKFYYALNRTGVVVWKLVAAGQASTADALADEIAARFEGTPLDEARRDVASLLRELEDEGLLLPAEPPGPAGG